MIYKYLEGKSAQAGVPQGRNAAAHEHAGHRRPLSSDRCQLQGQAGEDGGGFCRQRSAPKSDHILATRYMAESA